MAATNTPTLQDVVSDDFNYEMWARIVKTRLVEKELWSVVKNGIPPKPSKIPELAETTQPEGVSKWRDFVIKDSEALRILQSSLPDSVSRLTLETDSAKDLWDLLKEANVRFKLGHNPQSFIDRVMEIAVRLKSNHLAVTKLVVSLSDSYDNATDELILMGVKKLTFNCFRHFLDLIESSSATVGGILKMEFGASAYACEGFIKWLNSISDSFDGTPLLMDELVRLKDLTFNTFRELLGVFESVPVETINGVTKGFEVGSSSCTEQVCYSPNDDLREFLAKLEKKFEQVGMKEGEGISSASEPKQDRGFMDVKRIMRSRNERGECIQCGGKGHVFKDCIKRMSQRMSQRSEASPERQMLLFNVSTVTFDKDMWTIDFGTSQHMTPHEKYFTTLDRTLSVQINLIKAGYSIMAKGMGDVTIMTKEGKKKKKKKIIKNVLFAPNINRNVLSVDQMTEEGYGIVMSANKCTIKDQTGRLFGESMREDRGFFLRLKVVEGNLTSDHY